MNLAKGDPARIKLGEGAPEAAIQALRDEWGLNGNLFVRYFKHVFRMLHGDFGVSYTFGVPVFEMINQRFPNTLKLASGATIIMVLLGVPIGVISAVKKYTWIDSTTMVGSLILTSMPAFWLGLMLILLFALKLGLLPPVGADSYTHFIMPCITLAMGLMAALLRMTRSSMLEVIQQDYIRTARAKGAEERSVIYKHALRNALMPVVTVIGLNFGQILGGGMIVEQVFAIPGLGTMTINAVYTRDTPLAMAAIVFVALIVGCVNLIVDILYAFIDPRIKSQYVVVKKKKTKMTAKEASAL
jgi:peptide/nickel transport system permease protein